jgi:hypothetical protein
MESLRATCERDLHETLEGEWKIPVQLTSPDGQTQIYSVNDPSELLGGQVLNFSRRENPETGETTIVDQPVISLRISSLTRVPLAGERWFIRFPISPRPGAPLVSRVCTSDRSPEHGSDIGFLRLYVQKVDQSAGPGPEPES